MIPFGRGVVLCVRGRSLADDWLHRWKTELQFTAPRTKTPRWRFPDGSVIRDYTDIDECPWTVAEPAGEVADMTIRRRARTHARWRSIRVAWQKLLRALRK